MEYKRALDITRQKDEHGKAVPFDISFISYDRHRNKGGEHIEMSQVVRVKPPGFQESMGLICIRSTKNHRHPITVQPRLILRINGELVN